MSNSETNDSKKLSLEDRLQKIKAELEAVICEVERTKIQLGGGNVFADQADITIGFGKDILPGATISFDWDKQSSERKEGWYRKTTGILAHTNGYGININHEWVETQIWMDRNPHLWTPATPKEVKEALIKVAEKMGFKEGVRFKIIVGIYSGTIIDSPVKEFESFNYHNDSDELIMYWEYPYHHSYTVYKKGQWAEIISEPKLTLGGYDVKIYENRGDYPIWINHGYFSIEQIEMFSKATQEEYKALLKTIQ